MGRTAGSDDEATERVERGVELLSVGPPDGLAVDLALLPALPVREVHIPRELGFQAVLGDTRNRVERDRERVLSDAAETKGDERLAGISPNALDGVAQERRAPIAGPR